MGRRSTKDGSDEKDDHCRYYERMDAYMVRARMVLYATFNTGGLQNYEPSTVTVSPLSTSFASLSLLSRT